MHFLLVCAAALFASALTFFSGFGLGTLLLPVFAIFFPLEVAIAQTAVVHLANNLFKLALVGRHIDRNVALRFGIPAMLAAFAGAWLLLQLDALNPLFSYWAFGQTRDVHLLALFIALFMIVFAVLEIHPSASRWSFAQKYLPLGGALSGFFGGLSGHQGALRSAFLVKCNLSTESFVATGVVIACAVDVTRLSIYAGHFSGGRIEDWSLTLAATVAAFVGAYVGRQMLHKITLRLVQYTVAVMLFVIALGLASGFI